MKLTVKPAIEPIEQAFDNYSRTSNQLQPESQLSEALRIATLELARIASSNLNNLEIKNFVLKDLNKRLEASKHEAYLDLINLMRASLGDTSALAPTSNFVIPFAQLQEAVNYWQAYADVTCAKEANSAAFRQAYFRLLYSAPNSDNKLADKIRIAAHCGIMRQQIDVKEMNDDEGFYFFQREERLLKVKTSVLLTLVKKPISYDQMLEELDRSRPNFDDVLFVRSLVSVSGIEMRTALGINARRLGFHI